MASNFKLTLDTTPPSFSGTLNGSAPVTSVRKVALILEVLDSSRAGYQYKVWGDIAGGITEEEAEWQAYGEPAKLTTEVELTEGDGAKSVHVKIRDDVWNETTGKEFTVELNTSVPTITITAGPSPTKISEIEGKRIASFTFKADETISQWKVEVVEEEGSGQGSGTAIGSTNGSVASGAELAAETNKEGSIDGRDLDVAVGADGEYILKVFGKSKASGLWSI